jgi:hypothetical protein
MGEGVTAALGSNQRLLQELLVPDDGTFQRLHPDKAHDVSPLARAPQSSIEVLDG